MMPPPELTLTTFEEETRPRQPAYLPLKMYGLMFKNFFSRTTLLPFNTGISYSGIGTASCTTHQEQPIASRTQAAHSAASVVRPTLTSWPPAPHPGLSTSRSLFEI